MNGDELRAKYNTAYRIIKREAEMRAQVFPLGNPKHEEKQREMQRLLEIVAEFKDELKQVIGARDYEQPTLLDVPRKAEYK